MKKKALTNSQIKEFISFLKKEVEGKYISSPSMYTGDTFVFHLSNKKYHSLVFSLESSFPRLYLRDSEMDVSSLEGHFLSSLKKELGNAYIEEIEQYNDDRVIRFKVSTTSITFKEETKFIFFELVPNHPNLIVTDDSLSILLAYRTSSLEDKRPILKGMKYSSLEKGDFHKESLPFVFDEYEEICLSKEEELAKRRKNEKFGETFSFFKNKKKLLQRKITRLENDIEEAKKHLNDGLYGEAVYMCYSEIKPKQSSFEYEGMHIALDPSKSASQNAESFFKRAKKAKESIRQSEIHLEETRKELEHVELVLDELDIANEAGLEALAKDLNFSHKKDKKETKNYGVSRENLPYYIILDDVKIVYGKNAKQNAFLTFIYDTSKEHLWFHILSRSGSHLMIKTDSPNEKQIRIAAEICLINSNENDGDVMMAKRKNVKRGHTLGEALVKEYETIHLRNVSSSTRDLLKEERHISLKERETKN